MSRTQGLLSRGIDMATSAAAHHQEETRTLRRPMRRTRHRDWSDYGPPPFLPLRSPTAQEVGKALRQRRMSPTQTSIIQYMRDLCGTRGWCYFSTRHWVKELDVARTQLLRSRRELVDLHIIYYQEFPPESAPYVDQPDCGWIGFYPPAEWRPRTRKSWGGARAHAGRHSSQADCNNLNSEERQAEHVEAVIFLPAAAPQTDTGCLVKGAQIDTECLIQTGSQTEADEASPYRSGTNIITLSSDSGFALAAPNLFDTEEKIAGQTASSPPLDVAETHEQQNNPASDEGKAPQTAEFQESSEHCSEQRETVSPETLAAWRQELKDAREDERQAWEAFAAARSALDAARYDPSMGRDRLVQRHDEASREYHFARDRREAFALIIRLAEEGVPKEEALERTLECYPHLRKEPEDAEPAEATLEAWPLLTAVQWQRSLFGQFCRLWNWPTDSRLNRDARGRLNAAVKTLQLVSLRPEYVSLFVTWWKRENAWRTNAMPWDLTASVNDFFNWQEWNQVWDPLPEVTASPEYVEAPPVEVPSSGGAVVEGEDESPARLVGNDEASWDDLIDDPAWIAQLSRFVPDAEGARDGRELRNVQMLWGFVRDALRPDLNTARRQHLDSLVPAWHPAAPRELLLLGSTSYTIRFTNMALMRDIDSLIAKLLGRFFDSARPVFVAHEIIEQLQRQEQEASK